MTITDTFKTADEFVKTLDTVGRAHPQTWVWYNGLVAGRTVSLKTFGRSYLQRFTVDGSNANLPPIDSRVTVWKAAVLAGVN